MLCPITFRISLWFNSYRIPIKELRLEHNWLICRQLIVFAGNFLTLIYGLMILISINLFANQSLLMKELLCRQILNNAFTTGVCLIIIASFGCASLFIKREFVANFVDLKYQREQNDGKARKIVSYSGDDHQTVLDSLIHYSLRKLKLLKRCFILSPIFTLNAVLITSLMPFEFAIIKKCIHYLIDHRTGIKFYNKSNTSALLLILCLNVLFISVVLVHLIVFIYVCDLINTSLNKHLQQKQHKQHELCSRSESHVNRQLQNQIRIQALRQKNILFQQFLCQNKSSPKSLSEILSEKNTRSLSEATTIAISEAQDNQSFNGYIESSAAHSSYAIYL